MGSFVNERDYFLGSSSPSTRLDDEIVVVVVDVLVGGDGMVNSERKV